MRARRCCCLHFAATRIHASYANRTKNDGHALVTAKQRGRDIDVGDVDQYPLAQGDCL